MAHESGCTTSPVVRMTGRHRQRRGRLGHALRGGGRHDAFGAAAGVRNRRAFGSAAQLHHEYRVVHGLADDRGCSTLRRRARVERRVRRRRAERDRRGAEAARQFLPRQREAVSVRERVRPRGLLGLTRLLDLFRGRLRLRGSIHLARAPLLT